MTSGQKLDLVSPSVLLINGPNLNLLGTRNPAVYGVLSLSDIEDRMVRLGKELGVDVACRQSNSEGAIIDMIHGASGSVGIVINPGAYAHYSYAIRDAIEAVPTRCVEVHISNIHARDDFRHKSVLAPVTDGFICGMGVLGYELGLRAICALSQSAS